MRTLLSTEQSIDYQMDEMSIDAAINFLQKLKTEHEGKKLTLVLDVVDDISGTTSLNLYSE
jgi:hypothetical protein